MKKVLSNGVATGSLVINTVRDSFVEAIEQMNARKRPLYDAEFGEIEDIASATGKGWCISGDLYLNSAESTNRNMAVFGSSGSRKTVTIGMCKLLNPKGQSMVVHDPEGSMLPAAKYLESKGYRVHILDFNDPDNSDAINPLDFVKTESDAGKLAGHLVRGTLGSTASDKFWLVSASGVLRLLICVILKQEAKYRNMKNVQHLLFKLAADKEALFKLVVKSMSDSQFTEFVALVKGNEKTLASIVMTCQSALEIFNSDSVSRLTSVSTVDFESFRKVPSVLFLKNHTADSVSS